MDNIHQHSTPNTYKVLVGNKVDSKHRQVSTERGAAAAEEYDMPFFETSAKDGTNVVDTFHTLAAQIVKRINNVEATNADTKQPAKAVKKSGSACTVQ
jgi:Ras-related protein Rab-8A